MHDTRVAKRYARALFSAATAGDMVGAVESDLNTIVAALNSDPRLATFMIAPQSSRDAKHALLTSAFGDRATALTLQILRVMLNKGRESEITAVRDEFVVLRREMEGVILAVITSAGPLDEGQQIAIQSKLTQKLNKKVETEFRVDPFLIGGVRVAYGDYVLDGSVRGTLNSMRERLRHDVLIQP